MIIVSFHQGTLAVTLKVNKKPINMQLNLTNQTNPGQEMVWGYSNKTQLPKPNTGAGSSSSDDLICCDNTGEYN